MAKKKTNKEQWEQQIKKLAKIQKNAQELNVFSVIPEPEKPKRVTQQSLKKLKKFVSVTKQEIDYYIEKGYDYYAPFDFDDFDLKTKARYKIPKKKPSNNRIETLDIQNKKPLKYSEDIEETQKIPKAPPIIDTEPNPKKGKKIPQRESEKYAPTGASISDTETIIDELESILNSAENVHIAEALHNLLKESIQEEALAVNGEIGDGLKIITKRLANSEQQLISDAQIAVMESTSEEVKYSVYNVARLILGTEPSGFTQDYLEQAIFEDLPYSFRVKRRR